MEDYWLKLVLYSKASLHKASNHSENADVVMTMFFEQMSTYSTVMKTTQNDG